MNPARLWMPLRTVGILHTSTGWMAQKLPGPHAMRGSIAYLLALTAALAVFAFQTAPSAAAQTGGEEEAPGRVSGLTLSSSGDSVTVRWGAPANGGEAKGYIVHLRPDGGGTGSGRTKKPKAKKTTVTFDNLEAGATYRVWVRARNGAGKGERVAAYITLPETDGLPESWERPVDVVRCHECHPASYCDSLYEG